MSLLCRKNQEKTKMALKLDVSKTLDEVLVPLGYVTKPGSFASSKAEAKDLKNLIEFLIFGNLYGKQKKNTILYLHQEEGDYKVGTYILSELDLDPNVSKTLNDMLDPLDFRIESKGPLTVKSDIGQHELKSAVKFVIPHEIKEPQKSTVFYIQPTSKGGYQFGSYTFQQ